MKTISGFWAGTYSYPEANAPTVKFDCELRQDGSVISGEITESHRAGQMLLAGISGQLTGQNIQFIKSYRNGGETYLWDIAYSGQVSPKKDHISGSWRVGMRQGTFEMHRDSGELREIETRETADDLFVKK